MGSRGRSIRLRIYFLVAIPLITMLGLFADVAYSSVTNFVNLDRAPSLIRSTSVPMAEFMSLLQAERRAGVVYASKPSRASLNAYDAAVSATQRGLPVLEAALSSPGTKSAANGPETAAIGKFLGAVTGMTSLRDGVRQPRAMTPLQVLSGYTTVIDGVITVFQAETSSMTNVTAATQGLGLIATVTAREDLDIQDAVLAGALASGTLTPPERVAFVEASGREQGDEALLKSTLGTAELGTFTATFDKLAPRSAQAELLGVRKAVEGGFPLPALKRSGLNGQRWQQLTSTVANANFQGGLAAADASLSADQQLADNARTTVWLTGALGAAGLILTLIVTVFLGRSINRRLTRLRRSALALAREHLPSVVARLRRGEAVDVAAEAPPLRMGNDEIGQVGLAFDAVRQTAIAAAVEEARLRQGVNDVFRSLARRSQSLLQRQLTVLDGMERRATDADVLDDLFKLDHLTTRMRRHAEGLIILSGAPPGRGWSSPVKLVDVMRGAAAEVEDYARVTVSTQSRAALSGTAVTDVIHLLAELIENATTLSPPFTPVRVTGEMVANGFAIEIEDRGLGITPPRLDELNERLANPPDVNPANAEQLGLFVVAQLARRHGIGVTLRPSPYGGTTAVALIPRRLVVDDGPAALTSGAGSSEPGTVPAGGATAGTPAFTPGGPAAAAMGNRSGSPGSAASDASDAAGSPPDLDNIPIGNFGSGIRITGGYRQTAPPATPAPPATIVPGVPVTPAVRAAAVIPPAAGQAGAERSRRGRHGTEEVPVVTGVPVSRDAAPPFDVFTPLSRPGDGSDDPYQGAYQGAPYPDNDDGADGQRDGEHDTGTAGLPRRVRQASLAPQLRSSSAADAADGAGVPQASGASLADMRNTLSALQRGWQQGRTQPVQPDTEGRGDES